MCTVTWVHSAAGFELFSNRDEKRTRAPALGLRELERDGVRFLAPLDGNFGGTWIGANEFGLALCLLNGAGAAWARISRGLLVLDLLSSSSAAEAAERLARCDLLQFAPFTLVLLERGAAEVLHWDGREAGAGARSLPLVSSSVDPEGVARARRGEFQRVVREADARLLRRFHASHAAGPSAYSPCMHRPDAETVSFSAVRVTASEVQFRYAPAAPCRRTGFETATLPLRR